MIREDYECEVGVGLEIALNILFSLLPEFGQVCKYSMKIQFQELHCECQLHYRASSRASYHQQGKYIQKTYNPSYYTLTYLVKGKLLYSSQNEIQFCIITGLLCVSLCHEYPYFLRDLTLRIYVYFYILIKNYILGTFQNLRIITRFNFSLTFLEE